jgi:hypothetical protein
MSDSNPKLENLDIDEQDKDIVEFILKNFDKITSKNYK